MWLGQGVLLGSWDFRLSVCFALLLRALFSSHLQFVLLSQALLQTVLNFAQVQITEMFSPWMPCNWLWNRNLEHVSSECGVGLHFSSSVLV